MCGVSTLNQLEHKGTNRLYGIRGLIEDLNVQIIKQRMKYLCSKINQMHNISNLFYFGTTLYMFRTVFPSIIRRLRLYIQHQIYVLQVLWLLARYQPQNLYGMMLYVQS